MGSHYVIKMVRVGCFSHYAHYYSYYVGYCSEHVYCYFFCVVYHSICAGHKVTVQAVVASVWATVVGVRTLAASACATVVYV